MVVCHVKRDPTALNIGLKIFFRYSNYHVTFLEYFTTKLIEQLIYFLDRRR